VKINVNNANKSIKQTPETKNGDTEYSFSEEYQEKNEETRPIENAPINKFSLNLNLNKNNNVQCLNFESLKRNDFNDEFIQNYEDFSPSWRLECDKINLRKSNKQ
jgi:hypothetical protein